MKQLGKYLSEARAAKSFTQRQVESVTSISNAYLSQLETGKIKTPSPQVLHKLSLLYDAPYETLMELAGYPVPQANKTHVTTPEGARLAARIGRVSPGEEEALVDYLRFLRSRSGNE